MAPFGLTLAAPLLPSEAGSARADRGRFPCGPAPLPVSCLSRVIPQARWRGGAPAAAWPAREQALAGSVGARQPGAEAVPPRPRGSRSRPAGELVQCLRRNRTASTMITMITIAPKLINMGYSSRMRGAQDGEPGRRGGEPRGAGRRARRVVVARPPSQRQGVVVAVRSGAGGPGRGRAAGVSEGSRAARVSA